MATRAGDGDESGSAADGSTGKAEDSPVSVDGLGTERDYLAGSIELTYSENSAKARWEDDHLIVEMDGDIDSEEARETCSTLTRVLGSTGTAEIRFPNGTIPCE